MEVLHQNYMTLLYGVLTVLDRNHRVLAKVGYICLVPSFRLGTVTLAGWRRVSVWVSVCPPSVRAAPAALQIDRPSVRAGQSWKLGPARRRPRVSSSPLFKSSCRLGLILCSWCQSAAISKTLKRFWSRNLTHLSSIIASTAAFFISAHKSKLCFYVCLSVFSLSVCLSVRQITQKSWTDFDKVFGGVVRGPRSKLLIRYW